MDTNTLDAQLYLTRDEHATLLNQVAGTARHIHGPYLQLTPASMATILNAIDAAGGSIPEGLEAVYSAVEAAWLELHGRAPAAA
jgi:hypothetical protein